MRKTFPKHCKLLLAVGLCACLLLGACGNREDTGLKDETQSETVTMDVESDTEDAGEEEDTPISRSLMVKGNNYRMKQVLAKIAAGEDVCVGWIGGSITYGYNAGTEDIFAKLVTEYLDTAYGTGEGKVTYVNAGISGTPSMLGLVRAERDLLYAEPDLIFIEFAVNDAQSFTDKQAYESLIRKCLNRENAPAVVLLCSVTNEGYTCQDHMSQTGFYYNLPVISVKNAIWPEIEAGNMTWADWSKDEAHPNPEGHALYAQFIEHLIDTCAEAEEDPETEVPEATKFGKDWSGMILLSNEDILDEDSDFSASSAHGNFQKSWSYEVTEAEDGSIRNAPMEFEITGSTLFLVYKSVNSDAYGTAEVRVDGEIVAHLEANMEDGWNNPVTELIFSDDTSQKHQVSICMQAGDEDKQFDLLAIGVSE